MKVEKISEFCQAKGLTQIVNIVRANIAGYKYLTFVDPTKGEDGAENVYFAKALSENDELVIGEPLPATIASGLQIAHTINAAGEARVKLCGQGANRVSVTDMFS